MKVQTLSYENAKRTSLSSHEDISWCFHDYTNFIGEPLDFFCTLTHLSAMSFIMSSSLVLSVLVLITGMLVNT